MNSVQLRCRMLLVNDRPPTTNTCLSYCFSFSTSAMKSLSLPTMAKPVMWWRVKAISSASSARLMSAPFLSPRGVVALYHVDGVLGHLAALVAGARPVAVGHFGNHLAPLLQRLE